MSLNMILIKLYVRLFLLN